MEKNQQNEYSSRQNQSSADQHFESTPDLQSIAPPALQLKANGISGEEESEQEKGAYQLKEKEFTFGAEDNPSDASSPNTPFQLKEDTANNTGLPDNLKSGVENLSGFSLDDVKVHYNSSQPAQLQAHAYAQGSEIHIGPGQEKHLPHEAWHVVQQKQGRVQPTTQLKGKYQVNDDQGLEKEADVMGMKAFHFGKNNLDKSLNEQSQKNLNIVQRNKIENDFDQKSVNISVGNLFDLDSEAFSKHMAQKIWMEVIEKGTSYVFQGLGGGGAKFYRTKEVKAFRGEMKEKARLRVFDEIDNLQHEDSATGDYQRMVASNIAYEEVKEVIDTQLKSEAFKIVNDVLFSRENHFLGSLLTTMRTQLYELPQDIDAMKNYRFPSIPQDEKKKRYNGMMKEIRTEAESLYTLYKGFLKAKKDEIVRKPNPKNSEVNKESGQEVIDRVVEKVSTAGIGRKSLEQAIHAPTMNKGMRILGLLIDNVIPDSGEMVELSITFLIPTPQPGLEVEIGLSGLAARGIDGATTAGVAVMGKPKRVEVAAKFKVGVAAEAIGLKSDGTIGIFVRAGSDQGTEAALQALSYGAYRGASPEAFQNLWAPDDKATKVRKQANNRNTKDTKEAEKKAKKIIKDNNSVENTKKAIKRESENETSLENQWSEQSTSVGDLPKENKQHNERSKRLRAEMWAAMIEEKYFKGTNGQTFADVGLAIDGSFGVNFGVAQMDLGLSESIFSHYDEEVLDKTLGNKFAKRVDGEQGAKERRELAKGDKKLSLGGSINFTIGTGPYKIELGLSISGGAGGNIGFEIIGGATTAGDQAGPAVYDEIMNNWMTGLGEMIKKLRSTASKQMNDDSTGVWGNFVQLLADGTALVDIGKDHGIRSAMEGVQETVTAVNPTENVHFDTAIGEEIASDATTKTNLFSASTMLLFVFTAGFNGGKGVARFELRSKRGLDISAPSIFSMSMSKTTRLFAIGKELDGKVHAEIAGGRVQ